ncbi:MAG: M48 family metalloprotease, partial [Myxococcota bacterium]
RHAARQDAHMRTLGLATLISDMMSGGEVDQPESERISGHFGARYARNQEREADRIGQDLALAAGVDPLGMPRFLQSLDHLTKLEHGSSQQQTYFSSHPATPERVAEATTAAHARRWREPALGVKSKPALSDERDRELYLDRIDGMPVQRPAYEGVFRENRFLHPDLGFSLRFPPGWRTHNEPSQVFAVAPFRDGVVLMHGPSLGDDPRAAAEDFATREGLELENPQVLRIAGLSAYRAKAVVRTRLGAIDAEITWIAYGGHVYPMLAGMEPGARRKYRALFRRFAHGFRPLSDEERDSVRELRLRSVRALEGESLAALSTRSGNQWDLLYTAVANGLQVDTRLEEGQRIKIARLERYEPEPPEPGEPADEPGAAASGFGPTR